MDFGERVFESCIYKKSRKDYDLIRAFGPGSYRSISTVGTRVSPHRADELKMGKERQKKSENSIICLFLFWDSISRLLKDLRGS